MDPQVAWDEMLTAVSERDWEQAEEFYAAAVARCPTDERARCGYAEALWQRGARMDAVGSL